MCTFYSLLIILLLGAMLLSTETDAKKQKKENTQGCPKLTAPPYNRTRLNAVMKNGAIIVMGNKLDLLDKGTGATPVDTDKSKIRDCYKIVVNTQAAGELETVLTCTYNDVMLQTCHLKTERDVADAVKFYGSFMIIFTDDEKYWVSYGCLFGKTPMWCAQIPKGATLEPEDREDILKYMHSIGFSREEKDLKSDKDPVNMKSVKATKCPKLKVPLPLDDDDGLIG